MDPITISALIGAGGSLVGGATNAISDIFTNRRSEQFSREMFDKTQQANLAQWNLQNEYNSPQNQMKRFQEAGLNPNLIYGQGSAGNAGAIPTPDVQSVQRRSPQFGSALMDATAALNSIYDLRIKAAQADNLKAQGSVLAEDALLKATQRGAIEAGRDNTLWDLQYKNDLRETNADYRREQLRQLTTNIDNSIAENVRRQLLMEGSLAEMSQRVAESVERTKGYAGQRSRTVAETARTRQDISRMRIQEGVLKETQQWYQLDNDLRRLGINPNDPTYMRIAARSVNGFLNQKAKSPFEQGVIDAIKQFFK